MSALIDDELVEMVARALGAATNSDVAQIQSFHYPDHRPPYVIRDLRKVPGEQVVWGGESADAAEEALDAIVLAEIARAALAIAVPHVVEKCAQIAAEVGEEQRGHRGRNAAGIRMGASSCFVRIRSLTGPKP